MNSIGRRTFILNCLQTGFSKVYFLISIPGECLGAPIPPPLTTCLAGPYLPDPTVVPSVNTRFATNANWLHSQSDKLNNEIPLLLQPGISCTRAYINPILNCKIVYLRLAQNNTETTNYWFHYIKSMVGF